MTVSHTKGRSGAQNNKDRSGTLTNLNSGSGKGSHSSYDKMKCNEDFTGSGSFDSQEDRIVAKGRDIRDASGDEAPGNDNPSSSQSEGNMVPHETNNIPNNTSGDSSAFNKLDQTKQLPTNPDKIFHDPNGEDEETTNRNAPSDDDHDDDDKNNGDDSSERRSDDDDEGNSFMSSTVTTLLTEHVTTILPSSSSSVGTTYPYDPTNVSQGTTDTPTETSASEITTSTSASRDVSLSSLTVRSSASQGRTLANSSSSPIEGGNGAALMTSLPIAVIFLLILFVGFIFFRKKSLKRSKQDTVKSKSKDSQLELGDIKHTVKDYNGTITEDGRERNISTETQKVSREPKYMEIEEKAQPMPGEHTGLPENNNVLSQNSDGYEEAKVTVTLDIDGYEQVINEAKKKVYEKADGRGEVAHQGYERTKRAGGPFYHTLNPDEQSEPSYTAFSGSKQKGEYDVLDRQKIPLRPSNKTDSNYNCTNRVGKGDVKLEPSGQIGSVYSSTRTISAYTSDYDKLDHLNRNRDQHAGNISPNEYNIFQSREKV